MEATTGTIFAFATKMRLFPKGCYLRAPDDNLHERAMELAMEIWKLMTQMGWPMREAEYRQAAVTVGFIFHGEVAALNDQPEESSMQFATDDFAVRAVAPDPERDTEQSRR